MPYLVGAPLEGERSTTKRFWRVGPGGVCYDQEAWTVEDKAKIVVESLTMSASTVDICKKYGLSPNTFYPWREKFLEGGKAALAGRSGVRTIRAIQKENATLKTLVGEITLANDVLKKALEGRSLVQKPMTIGS